MLTELSYFSSFPPDKSREDKLEDEISYCIFKNDKSEFVGRVALSV
jgi:hypothetical protein